MDNDESKEEDKVNQSLNESSNKVRIFKPQDLYLFNANLNYY